MLNFYLFLGMEHLTGENVKTKIKFKKKKIYIDWTPKKGKIKFEPSSCVWCFHSKRTLVIRLSEKLTNHDGFWRCGTHHNLCIKEMIYNFKFILPRIFIYLELPTIFATFILFIWMLLNYVWILFLFVPVMGKVSGKQSWKDQNKFLI